MKLCGMAKYLRNPETNEVQDIKISVDPRRNGIVSCVIHELLHIYMRQGLSIDKLLAYDMEEQAILTWEAHLYNYIHPRPELLESWERAIKRKLDK
jgi:hypothetical protein